MGHMEMFMPGTRKHHNAAEREAYARQAQQKGNDWVASKTGVQPATVQSWRNEFGLTADMSSTVGTVSAEQQTAANQKYGSLAGEPQKLVEFWLEAMDTLTYERPTYEEAEIISMNMEAVEKKLMDEYSISISEHLDMIEGQPDRAAEADERSGEERLAEAVSQLRKGDCIEVTGEDDRWTVYVSDDMDVPAHSRHESYSAAVRCAEKLARNSGAYIQVAHAQQIQRLGD